MGLCGAGEALHRAVWEGCWKEVVFPWRPTVAEGSSEEKLQVGKAKQGSTLIMVDLGLLQG